MTARTFSERTRDSRSRRERDQDRRKKTADHDVIIGQNEPCVEMFAIGEFARRRKSRSLGSRKTARRSGYPAWIRTMNNASKGRCVTVTPRGKMVARDARSLATQLIPHSRIRNANPAARVHPLFPQTGSQSRCKLLALRVSRDGEKTSQDCSGYRSVAIRPI